MAFECFNMLFFSPLRLRTFRSLILHQSSILRVVSTSEFLTVSAFFWGGGGSISFSVSNPNN